MWLSRRCLPIWTCKFRCHASLGATRVLPAKHSTRLLAAAWRLAACCSVWYSGLTCRCCLWSTTPLPWPPPPAQQRRCSGGWLGQLLYCLLGTALGSALGSAQSGFPAPCSRQACSLAGCKGALWLQTKNICITTQLHATVAVALLAACRYLSALRSCFAAGGKELVGFERYMALRKSGGNHCHFNAIAVPGGFRPGLPPPRQLTWRWGHMPAARCMPASFRRVLPGCTACCGTVCVATSQPVAASHPINLPVCPLPGLPCSGGGCQGARGI